MKVKDNIQGQVDSNIAFIFRYFKISKLSSACKYATLKLIITYCYLQRLQQEEDLRQAEWERQQNANARAGLLLEREMERKKRDLDRAQAEENRRLAKEQKSHQNFLDNEVYTNPPTASYFMQFNTSTRWKRVLQIIVVVLFHCKCLL